MATFSGNKGSGTLQSAAIVVYLNGTVAPELTAINYQFDYGIKPIFSIDNPYPVELAQGAITVNGSVQGLRLSKTLGLMQDYNLRPLAGAVFNAQYCSIRIYNRRSKQNILFVPNAYITNQKVDINNRRIVTVDFNFTGLIGFEQADS